MALISPQLVVIAGPNGAGKSTSAPALLPEGMPFINADDIAARLDDATGNKEIAAGRELLNEWTRLEKEQADFAVETTLSSVSLAPRIKRLKQAGYQFHLIYIWLPSVDVAIQRVAERVRLGGHNIPELTISRRYARGINNCFNLYMPLADSWVIYLNSVSGDLKCIAKNDMDSDITVLSPEIWKLINDKADR